MFDLMGMFVSFFELIVNEEMDFYWSYVVEFGIDIDEFEVMMLLLMIWVYMDFFVCIVMFGLFGDIVVVLFFCMWGFNEMGCCFVDVGVLDYD